MTESIPKTPPLRLPKLRNLPKRGDIGCTMKLVGICNYTYDTVVLAHSEEPEHHQGWGQKPSDLNAAFMCQKCHDIYDGRVYGYPSRLVLRDNFFHARAETHQIAIQHKIIDKHFLLEQGYKL